MAWEVEWMLTYKCKTCGHIKTTDIAKINQITISKTKYEYTGKAFKPTVTVKDSNGQVISTQNYNIIYSSNKKVGNGTVKIVFKGNYSGTITKIFKKAKTTTAKSSLKTKTITKLKNKKKYYFRMRAYKKVSGTKVYGVYSSKKTVKITK